MICSCLLQASWWRRASSMWSRLQGRPATCRPAIGMASSTMSGSSTTSSESRTCRGCHATMAEATFALEMCVITALSGSCCDKVAIMCTSGCTVCGQQYRTITATKWRAAGRRPQTCPTVNCCLVAALQGQLHQPLRAAPLSSGSLGPHVRAVPGGDTSPLILASLTVLSSRSACQHCRVHL